MQEQDGQIAHRTSYQVRNTGEECSRILEFAIHRIRVVQTPYQAPNANAYAERFVRPIQEECLDRMIPLGERHFRRTVREFVAHYYDERNHQGLQNALIAGAPAIGATAACADDRVWVGCSTITSERRDQQARPNTGTIRAVILHISNYRTPDAV